LRAKWFRAAKASAGERVFTAALKEYFHGELDRKTIERL